MPCCGITIEHVYAMLKANEVEGSGAADRILGQLLSADKEEPIKAEGLKKPNQEPRLERILT